VLSTLWIVRQGPLTRGSFSARKSALIEADEQQLRREVPAAERAAVIGLGDRGRIDDETLRLVERELDLEEQRWQE
jgi:hypothetical protein